MPRVSFTFYSALLSSGRMEHSNCASNFEVHDLLVCKMNISRHSKKCILDFFMFRLLRKLRRGTNSARFLNKARGVPNLGGY